MSWSTARRTSTSTPCLRMIAALASTSPWVWLRSGERFSVQLTNMARRPVKSSSVMGRTLLRKCDLGNGCGGGCDVRSVGLVIEALLLAAIPRGTRSESNVRLLPGRDGNPMAQRVNVVLVDDIDGSDAAETVSFGLDGVQYDIDLSAANADKLRESLAGYIGHARRAASRSGV